MNSKINSTIESYSRAGRIDIVNIVLNADSEHLVSTADIDITSEIKLMLDAEFRGRAVPNATRNLRPQVIGVCKDFDTARRSRTRLSDYALSNKMVAIFDADWMLYFSPAIDITPFLQ